MHIEEIPWRSPLAAFAPFVGEPDAHLLHAGEKAEAPGWSVIVARPGKRLTVRNGVAFVDGASVAQAPFDALADIRKSRAFSWGDGCYDIAAPFFSGAVGFVGYEMGGGLEPSAKGPASLTPFPDMVFGFYDCAMLFDRAAKKSFVVSKDPIPRNFFDRAPAKGNTDPTSPVTFQSNLTKAAYEDAVSIVIARILDGDIFQANISQRLRAQADNMRPFDVYQRLSAKSDARFGSYLQYTDGAILSNSPERFFSIVKRGSFLDIRTEPIKGTRPRGSTPEEDRAFAAALLNDEKDRAENIMIADLMRNDLSRICIDDSITEDELCSLVSYASVHHMVSVISGILREGLSAVDALKALFPCGSITGAPKIEAMRLIAEIEKEGRGPYCGAIGYIDDRGGADFSVAIRTMTATRNSDGVELTLPVGGGVTRLSDPEMEYEETLVKARSFSRALLVSS